MSLCLGPRPVSPAPTCLPYAAPARFNHVAVPPSPSIASFIEHYWVTKWDRRDVPARAASSLLDPCVHLQVRNGRAEVMGVVRGAYRTRIERAGCVVGVKFRFGGFHPFVSRPVVEWTDRTVPANEVFAEATDAWAIELSNTIMDCRGDAGAHAAIACSYFDRLLGARTPARDVVAEDVAELVGVIASSSELRRVSDLARVSGNSERTLHRLFARYVGASPAWVIRRYRLRAAAERLTKSPGADVSALAGEFGYADQAHFIRDFRATVGVTPGVYVQVRG